MLHLLANEVNKHAARPTGRALCLGVALAQCQHDTYDAQDYCRFQPGTLPTDEYIERLGSILRSLRLSGGGVIKCSR
jgi:hypothetical protein